MYTDMTQGQVIFLGLVETTVFIVFDFNEIVTILVLDIVRMLSLNDHVHQMGFIVQVGLCPLIITIFSWDCSVRADQSIISHGLRSTFPFF